MGVHAAEHGVRKIRVNAVAQSSVPTEDTMRNRNAELERGASRARLSDSSAPLMAPPKRSAFSPATKEVL
jgi:hypothetical protein